MKMSLGTEIRSLATLVQARKVTHAHHPGLVLVAWLLVFLTAAAPVVAEVQQAGVSSLLGVHSRHAAAPHAVQAPAKSAVAHGESWLSQFGGGVVSGFLNAVPNLITAFREDPWRTSLMLGGMIALGVVCPTAVLVAGGVMLAASLAHTGGDPGKLGEAVGEAAFWTLAGAAGARALGRLRGSSEVGSAGPRGKAPPSPLASEGAEVAAIRDPLALTPLPRNGVRPGQQFDTQTGRPLLPNPAGTLGAEAVKAATEISAALPNTWIPRGSGVAPNGRVPLAGAIPRTLMPQIEAVDFPSFRAHLERRGIRSTEVSNFDLSRVIPMQNEADLIKVNGFLEKLARNSHALDKSTEVLIKDPGTGLIYALDGNHRTMALLVRNQPASNAIVIEGSPEAVLRSIARYEKATYYDVKGNRVDPPRPRVYSEFRSFFDSGL